jgi:hypothetical protein
MTCGDQIGDEDGPDEAMTPGKKTLTPLPMWVVVMRRDQWRRTFSRSSADHGARWLIQFSPRRGLRVSEFTT